jgi:hypothetical protein
MTQEGILYRVTAQSRGGGVRYLVGNRPTGERPFGEEFPGGAALDRLLGDLARLNPQYEWGAEQVEKALV